MAAFNAKTGELLWKHYNIPAPGEYGHETWPSDTTCAPCNAEWQHGGATDWNAPTVDPKLGLIFYGTANAGQDGYGGDRGGEDLWTVSLLALNAKTGQLAWGYQEVHHDLWDYDQANQPDMINVQVDGKTVEGVIAANKDGYLYFVNAETGKPIFPIEEKPVPQAPGEASFPTQPIPSMPPFYPQKEPPAAVAEFQKVIDKSAEEHGVPAPTVKNGGYNEEDVFSPTEPAGSPTVYISSNGGSGIQSAVNSYDPESGTYVVCGHLQDAATQNTDEEEEWHEGKIFAGGLGKAVGAFFGLPESLVKGYVSGYDLQTGKLLWQIEWPKACLAGSTATAGGVVFIGNEEDEEFALEASTGKTLWSWKLGAGVKAAPAVYEYDGKEYVTLYAGMEGDNLWTFTLNGTGPAQIEKGKTPPPTEKLTSAPTTGPLVH